MRILVDADACPVKDRIEKIAKKWHIPVIFFCDINHRIETDYGTVITVDSGRDSADIRLANTVLSGDVVVTQDYGLATLALARRAIALSASGGRYTEENIDRLLFERHASMKARNAGFRTKGPSKRKREDDEAFERNLREICLADFTKDRSIR